MPWSSFSECWALSQLFHSPLSLSSRGWSKFLTDFQVCPDAWIHVHLRKSRDSIRGQGVLSFNLPPDSGIKCSQADQSCLLEMIFHVQFLLSQPTFSSVQFTYSVVFNSLQPHERQHTRPPCPSLTSKVHPNPCPLSCISYLFSSCPLYRCKPHPGVFCFVSHWLICDDKEIIFEAYLEFWSAQKFLWGFCFFLNGAFKFLSGMFFLPRYFRQ